MLRLQSIKKKIIKDYWETRLPQVWYSNKKKCSIEWFNEIEYKRYNIYYDFLPDVFEFSHHSGEEVLEVGVGVGTDLVQFAKNGAVVSGVDLTENAIIKTKINFKLKRLKYKTLRVADSENLPFKDKSFDLVYSIGALHHTPRIDLAVREVHRVLKDEGKAIILIYARGWKHYLKRVIIHGILLGKLFRYGYNKLINLQTEVHGHSPLTYVLKKKEIKKLFEKFDGIEITKHRMGEYFDYAPYNTRKVPRFIRNILDLFTIEKLLGENYVIKAVKTNKKPRYSFWKTLLKT